MNRTLNVAIIAAVAVLSGLTASSTAAHTAPGFSMEVLVNGVPVTEYPARGTTYVEAIPEAEYSLRLTNSSPVRVAVALSVDGLNTIDARTTSAREARKWVLDPWQTVTITGWQTDQLSARKFFFTTEERSYGAWLGKVTNLGVIEAVVFRERPRPPIITEKDSHAPGRGQPAAPEAQGEARSESSRPLGVPDPAPSDDYAATGIGREVSNPVYQVHMDLERHPSAQLRLRYEYRPQLVRLGVLPVPWSPDPFDRREQARGFCPDPYDR